MAKSSTGLAENIAGLLCYVLGWVSGLVFVLIEQESNFVRFHAIQSIYVFGILNLAAIVLGWIPFIGGVVAGIFWAVMIILWIFLMIKAYQGIEFKLPWVGDWAEKRVSQRGG